MIKYRKQQKSGVKKWAPLRLARQLLARYRGHGVAYSCAALTYYLVFAAFPLLVLLGTLPGALGWESESLLQALRRIVPQQMAEVIVQYWADAAANGGHSLLWSSLLFSLWLPARAADCLLWAVSRAFGTARPSGWREKARMLAFTLWLMATLVLALGLIIVGRRVLGGVLIWLGLPERWAAVWETVRFVLLGLVLSVSLAMLYMLALGRQPLGRILPGVLTSLAAWMTCSVGFSYYVEHMAGYTLLYGSVSAAVVILLWLYMGALALIMGAELNAVLHGGEGVAEKS